MKTSRLVGALAAALATLVTTSAFADETRDGDKSYAYIFDDDKLYDDLSDGATPRITVIKSAQRARLLTPRINFVPELLKSVENM